MAGFVKLDVGLLNSTLWVDELATRIFLTALLMAEPLEVEDPIAEIATRSLDQTGFVVQPGWYGFVAAAGVGIVARAAVDAAAGLEALERLANPDMESRSPDWDGRRMVRVPGGFIILNWEKYRIRDYTSADRSRRWRERNRNGSQRVDTRVATAGNRVDTQAEAEAEADFRSRSRVPSAQRRAGDPELERSFDEFWAAYAKAKNRKGALLKWRKLSASDREAALAAVPAYVASTPDKQYRRDPTTWLNNRGWEDEVIVKAAGKAKGYDDSIERDYGGNAENGGFLEF